MNENSWNGLIGTSQARTLIFALTALGLCLMSCSEDRRDGNADPVIQALSADPPAATPGSQVTLTCTAIDADNDSLEYYWSCPQGAFPLGTATSTVLWQAPDVIGVYTISVVVFDGHDADTDSLVLSVAENTSPVASFVWSPATVNAWTVLTVDAEGSTDNETPFNQLELRWDWENDGDYDTAWSSSRTATYQYASEGSFTIRLQVRDSGGLTADTTRTLAVGAGSPSVIEMIQVAPGSFTMGQLEVATPEHPVVLTHDFLLGRTEVTNRQFVEALNWAKAQGYVTVVGDVVKQHNVNLLQIGGALDEHEIRYSATTQRFTLRAATHDGEVWGPGHAFPTGYEPVEHPVVFLTWYGAACFCDWWSELNGLAPYYNGNWQQIPSQSNPYEATGYRLPTEAEWEYAAQFNDERTYPWGPAAPTSAHANFRGNNGFLVGWTSPVGAHPTGASGLGLQDMAGNVWEWCNDWHADYQTDSLTDPTGPTGGSERTLRGGSWNVLFIDLPCAYRNREEPDNAAFSFGLRLCRTLP